MHLRAMRATPLPNQTAAYRDGSGRAGLDQVTNWRIAVMLRCTGLTCATRSIALPRLAMDAA
jgi:hypothetical protein